jgi:hypothetical protein
MSIRLSTPQPPSGSISFSFKKTGRAREPAATPPRASVDGAAKDRVDDDAKESMWRWRNVARRCSLVDSEKSDFICDALWQ